MNQEKKKLLISNDGKCPKCGSDKTDFISAWTYGRPMGSSIFPKPSKTKDLYRCLNETCKEVFLRNKK